ncbi:SNO glutamine amidotransferase [Suhomyces tanzawaensis NRRL Y-17324]|uniref:glutaminase n=1 Tax=Suhomyces tanzawaensis NRRL Y-17324 TaxID=984487 RepID=A0A1E4SD00_9ASCO|nr:SNO glutamine amidotransferase [Suhomyces tanzawaensis NRRL Y-17324]ODV77394.1 SNO glutamine amidotransferase [Suhomyces tanzawaensis NRRL Y-17324]
MTSFTIGVLALQGAFFEHLEFLKSIVQSPEYSAHTFQFVQVKTGEQLATCDSLVIPGGESTSISLIAERTFLLEPLLAFVRDPCKSVWGTCAGLIFLAQHLKNGKKEQKVLGGLNIEVTRNAFGRQLDSFEQVLDFSSFVPGLTDFPAVFIRAPVVSRIGVVDLAEEGLISSSNPILDEPVEVLHKLHRNGHELVVAVRQGNHLGTSFHPELSSDLRFHKWFLDEFVLKSAS